MNRFFIAFHAHSLKTTAIYLTSTLTITKYNNKEHCNIIRIGPCPYPNQHEFYNQMNKKRFSCITYYNRFRPVACLKSTFLQNFFLSKHLEEKITFKRFYESSNYQPVLPILCGMSSHLIFEGQTTVPISSEEIMIKRWETITKSSFKAILRWHCSLNTCENPIHILIFLIICKKYTFHLNY